MPADPILAKGHIRFIEARFPAVVASQLDITRRLTDHLWKLREAQERRLAEAAAPLRQEDAALQPAVGIRRAKGADAEGAKDDDLFLPPADRVLARTASTISLSAADRSKIDRRARRLFHRREAASGMKHLKKEDRDRLEVLARGVRLAVIPSEHRADELAAELHGGIPLAGARHRSGVAGDAPLGAGRLAGLPDAAPCCSTGLSGSASRSGRDGSAR
ncbi:hypothetical protein [Cereibacter changlensis]|uniref:hypothetical protein n=1 Tax=Cereibacter changlensis TaxID=402884 RepID=UPI004034B775